MNVSDAVRQRRSIKFFDPDHRMSEMEMRQLLELAILSPTAFNIQHWRFVWVRDIQQRAAVRALAWQQPQVTAASALLVLCMDLRAWSKQPQRYCRTAPPEVQTKLVESMREYYAANPQAERDEGMRSCGLIAMTIMLAAKEMGYDSCAMDGFDFAGVAQIIQLPEDHAICMMIALGKPAAPPFPRGGQLALSELLYIDRFGAAQSRE